MTNQEGGVVSRVNIGSLITASVTSRHTSVIFKMAGKFLIRYVVKGVNFPNVGACETSSKTFSSPAMRFFLNLSLSLSIIYDPTHARNRRQWGDKGDINITVLRKNALLVQCFNIKR